jgi:hypothetical protein
VLVKDCLLLDLRVKFERTSHNYIPCFTADSKLLPALLRKDDGHVLVVTHRSSKTWISIRARPDYVDNFGRGW